MNQHQYALDQIASGLFRYNYENKTASTAMYGDNAYVVGAAFDHWTRYDNRAASIGYEEQAYNDDADRALAAYETIADLARVQITAAAFTEQMDAELAELADMDAVQDDAANRGGY